MTQVNSREVTITDPYSQNCVQMVGPVRIELYVQISRIIELCLEPRC